MNRTDPHSRTEISEADTNLEINTDEPSKIESIATIKSLKNNKAPRNDNLPAEIFKADLILAADILCPLFCKIWRNSMIPTTWSDGNIHRDSLWKILRHYGVLSKIDDLVKAFYTEFKCTLGSSSKTSFLVKSGVRQGCMMSALLFIITVDWVMRSTFIEDNTGIR